MSYRKKLLLGVSLAVISGFVAMPKSVSAQPITPYSGGNTDGSDKTLTVTPTTDINFTAEDTVYVNDGINLGVAVTTTVNNQGTLAISGNSEANEQIGASGAAIGTILAGEAGVTATFNDDVYVNELRFGPGSGSIVLGDGVNFTGSINTTGGSGGTVELEGDAYISGAVGTASAVDIDFGGANGKTATFASSVGAADVNVSGTGDVVFQGALVASGDINFTADGKATIQQGSNITGSITTANDGEGTFAFDNNANVGGAIGAENQALKRLLISAGATVGVTGEIFSDDIQVLGSLSAYDDVDADIMFRSGVGSVSFAGAYDGDITAETNNWGQVEFTADATIDGSIGEEGKSINTLSLNALGAHKLTFNDTVYATDLSISNAMSEMEFNALYMLTT
ncbi:MAG: hypothetical protein AB7U85_03940 [Alphaproteobacteria bacterium]